MNLRGSTYFAYANWRGFDFPALYEKLLPGFDRQSGAAVVRSRLHSLLAHCRVNVPYYADYLADLPNLDDPATDPLAVLSRLPILTKPLIRNHFDRMLSADLPRRKWHYNTSGGSTGEPVRFVQDRVAYDWSTALRFLTKNLWGCAPGELELRLWGSERDVLEGTDGWRRRLFQSWTNVHYLNAFRMTPERMREVVTWMNSNSPKLIVAYAQAAYELAGFIQREGLTVRPQHALVTSAGTLYPFMRETMARVFGCPVYNQYGSREVSDIAVEVPGISGLWVPPWSVYVEVVDDQDMPVPFGSSGSLVVTCLKNYAMPLIRYRIGDIGSLWLADTPFANQAGQVLQSVQGRSVDAFRTRNGTVIDGEYFTHLMYFRPWVARFQVVQEALDRVVYRVVASASAPPTAELDEIIAKTRLVLGSACVVQFEFVPALPDPDGGKFRYTLSRVMV